MQSRPTGSAPWRRAVAAAVAAFCLLVLVPFGVRAELESTLALEMFAADKTQSGIVTDVRRDVRFRGRIVDVADVELRNGREVVIEGSYRPGQVVEVVDPDSSNPAAFALDGDQAPIRGFGPLFIVGGLLLAWHCVHAARARTRAPRRGVRRLSPGGRALVILGAIHFGAFPPLFGQGSTSWVPAALGVAVVLAAEVAARRATLRVDDDLLWRSPGKQLPLTSEVRLDPDSTTGASYLELLDPDDRPFVLWITLWDDPASIARLLVDRCLQDTSPDDGGSAAFLHRLAAFDRERQATDARA